MNKAKYNKEVKVLAINKNKEIKAIFDKYYSDLKNLKKLYEIPPNYYATQEEISNFIDIVLDKGKSGRLALDEYREKTINVKNGEKM